MKELSTRKLSQWIARFETVHVLVRRFEELAKKPHTNFEKLSEIERAIGIQVVELLRGDP